MSSIQAVAQKNSLYLELLGNGIVYSINYDRSIPLSNKISLAPRIGFEFLPHNNGSKYGNLSIPTEINLLISKNASSKNHFETGLGLNFIGLKTYAGVINGSPAYDNNKFARITTLRVGFRHQQSSGGFMYRAGLLTPLAQDNHSKKWVGDDIFYRLYIGFSLGYAF